MSPATDAACAVAGCAGGRPDRSPPAAPQRSSTTGLDPRAARRRRGGSSFDRARSTSRASSCRPDAAPVIGEHEIRVSYQVRERRPHHRVADHQRRLDARSVRQPRSRSERRARSRSRGRSDEHRRAALAVDLFSGVQQAFDDRSTVEDSTDVRSGRSAPAWRGASICSSRPPAARMRCRRSAGARELTRELGTGVHSRAICVGRRGDADLRAVLPVVDLRHRVRAGGVAMELPAAAAVVGVWRAGDGRDVDDRADPREHQPRQFHRALGRRRPPAAARRRTRCWSRIAFSISRTATSSARIPASTATSCCSAGLPVSPPQADRRALTARSSLASTTPTASPGTASDPRGTSSAAPRGSWRRRS